MKIDFTKLKGPKIYLPLAVGAILLSVLTVILIMRPGIILGHFGLDIKDSNKQSVSDENKQAEDSATTTDSANKPDSQNPTATNQTNQTTQTKSTTSPVPSGTSSNSAPTPSPAVTDPPSNPDPVITDTYPRNWATAQMDSIFDSWGMNNRESVSYTAWKVNEKYGNMPSWGHEGYGNALQWLTGAQKYGIPTGTSPKQYSVGIKEKNALPGIGFSAWVEKVDGANVTVSSYNWGTPGTFTTMTVPSSFFENYIYFGDR